MIGAASAPAFADELGPRARRRVLVASIVAGAAVVGFLVLAVRRLDHNGQLEADKWLQFTEWPVIRFFLGGLANTAKAAAAAMVLAIAVGGVLALARLARRRPLRWLGTLYVEFFRGLPLYLLILFCGFGLPRLDVPWLDFEPFGALVLALTIYNSSILAEIFRAGILSLDRGQGEAASAVGLGYWQSMAYVVVPQAVRRMVPAIVSQLVTLLKDTSLGSLIFYEELLRRARINADFTQHTLPSLVVVTGGYIVINFFLSWVATRLEARQRRRYGAGRIDVTGVEDLAGNTPRAGAGTDRSATGI
jgi:glutamate transport system permease protein